ncbi:hypothetical protein AC578_9898 [Pseudocercospora eumusae]|uniref:Uncharacterized protein n=1 Tax=Pseudocercospora eumusae TaxID=321146 RepID=A0A139HAZ9_9PEZI|nr:hypothetical protein AC578_9898 [Pseudocercospora eumusae]
MPRLSGWKVSLRVANHRPLILLTPASTETYYSDLDGFKPDIYSMRNPNHKEEWKKIQDIGITIITEEEKSRLPGHRNTATFRGTESQGEGYVVHLEAFHQLHCLKALRGAFYGDWEELRQYEDPDFHADHCWSYLVQTTICHADVAVMPTFWMDWSHDYKAYFNITRQCRNFEKIAEWARTRKPKCDEEGKATLDRILAKGLITPGTGKCTP